MKSRLAYILGACGSFLTGSALVLVFNSLVAPHLQKGTFSSKSSVAVSEPARINLPEPIPQEVATTWKHAGAEVGWVRPSNETLFDFVTFSDSQPGDIPAFRFSTWVKGKLEQLPDPGQPFALVLCCTNITDAGLTELAGLTNLQALDLGATRISDAELKVLAAVKGLRSLKLEARVTDSGLKGLLALRSLQDLSLQHSEITDMGIKELKQLTGLQKLFLGGTQISNSGLKELGELRNCS